METGVTVDPGAVIGPRAEIGTGTVINSGAAIGPNVRIGRHCAIGANASITNSLIGDRVIVHAGCAIGQDGFGYLMGATGHRKVLQIGRVIIQTDVEIGAGTTIDRAASATPSSAKAQDRQPGADRTQCDDRPPLHHRLAVRHLRQRRYRGSRHLAGQVWARGQCADRRGRDYRSEERA
jgi:acetyltransferase-like isoleucine patch superfamily enzyme